MEFKTSISNGDITHDYEVKYEAIVDGPITEFKVSVKDIVDFSFIIKNNAAKMIFIQIENGKYNELNIELANRALSNYLMNQSITKR